jgi:DNA-binding CsgD family transcriptional regulator
VALLPRVRSASDAELDACSSAGPAGQQGGFPEHTIVERMHVQLAWLADAAGPGSDRAEAMLAVLREDVPFDADWIARMGGSGYETVDLDAPVVDHLRGPKTARDIDVAGTDRPRPPLSPSDLPYRSVELPTWAECLIPGGLHEALAVALFEPGGRRVGFLALLSGDREPSTPSARRRLSGVVPLPAQGIDPMRSITAASGLVCDAFAGALLVASGPTRPVPGLADHRLLTTHSVLLDTVLARATGGEPYLSFLWPSESEGTAHDHVRVTYLAIPEPSAPDLLGVVLLSPTGPLHGLTHRELEVLGLIVEGCSNQQIAGLLVVTLRTVATHVEHILMKLSSPSRTHAAVHAQRKGLYVPLPVAPAAP